MANPPTASPPPPATFATPPSYGSITPSPSIEAQPQSPLLSPPPPPCHACGTSKPPAALQRGWIHACLGLQGARDPSYNEKAFQDTLVAFVLGAFGIAALTLVLIMVEGAGMAVVQLLCLGGGVVTLFTAFPGPWFGRPDRRVA